VDPPKSQSGDEIVHSLGHDDLRRTAPCPARRPNDTTQRGNIEVVHMRVCYQDKVDRRHLLDQNSGMTLASQHDKPGGKDGIHQNVPATDLEEERGVPDEGNTQLARLYQFGRP
jgi:hypothetical protein